MFICKQRTNFIINFFLEILHFKESCHLIGWQHRERQFCQIGDWWWNINNNISFHIRLFPGKTNDKIFKKIQKEPYLGPFLGPFYPNLGKNYFFLEKRTLSVFRYSNYLSLCQKSEKTIEQFLRKTPNWQTGRQTDNFDFIRPYIGKFLRIICLVHTKNCSKLNLSPSP